MTVFVFLVYIFAAFRALVYSLFRLQIFRCLLSNCFNLNCNDILVTQSIGFTPVYRGGLDGSILWTMIQTKGFPSAGNEYLCLACFYYALCVVRNF